VIKDLVLGVLPVIVVIMSTLGIILFGIATPTDAGAVGCFATFLLTVGSGRMSFAKIRKSAYQTLEVSSMILMLVAASNLFGSVFSRLGSPQYMAEWLLSLSLPPTLMLVLILALIFVLGWPLEWVPIVLIVVPVVLPIIQAANIDLIWFCTLVAVTLQTAWLSPPVALSAYFLKGVVPQWDLKQIYAGMVQFMILQLVGVGLVLLFRSSRPGCRASTEGVVASCAPPRISSGGVIVHGGADVAIPPPRGPMATPTSRPAPTPAKAACSAGPCSAAGAASGSGEKSGRIVASPASRPS
jgi:TRAP-type mannitol/chloroaromatic compound transport system permease large subunit